MKHFVIEYSYLQQGDYGMEWITQTKPLDQPDKYYHCVNNSDSKDLYINLD